MERTSPRLYPPPFLLQAGTRLSKAVHPPTNTRTRTGAPMLSRRAAAAVLLCVFTQPACAADSVSLLGSSPYAWVPCSLQGAVCECKGWVRYGARASWAVHARVQGAISCTDAIFGDPAVGTFKHCECLEEWLPCASENGECGCEGSVRYGASSNWTWAVEHNVSDSIACTTAEFGDPAPGAAKACECIAIDACTDLTFANGTTWHDSLQYSCSWYSRSPDYCATYGRGNRSVFTANEACCVCGGGERTHTAGATSTPVPTAVPTEAPKGMLPTRVPAATTTPVPAQQRLVPTEVPSPTTSPTTSSSGSDAAWIVVVAAAVLLVCCCALLAWLDVRRLRQGTAFEPQESVRTALEEELMNTKNWDHVAVME